MNRLSFLKTLCLSPLVFCFKNFKKEEEKPKIGYIDVLTLPGETWSKDWLVFSGEKQLHKVSAVNDIEGWYETIRWEWYCTGKITVVPSKRFYDKNVRLVYTGNVEKYKKFV
jgi:hypothetical protein